MVCLDFDLVANSLGILLTLRVLGVFRERLLTRGTFYLSDFAVVSVSVHAKEFLRMLLREAKDPND